QSCLVLYPRRSIPAGANLNHDKPIFPRPERDEEREKVKSLMTATVPAAQDAADEKPEGAQDGVTKVEMRVADLVRAERMKRADKYLQLQVDLGSEKRQSISGIAEYYAPEDLLNTKVICVTNLKPVELRGELSEGMILSGEGEDGRLSLAMTDQHLANG